MRPADVVRDAFLTSRHVATPDKCVTAETGHRVQWGACQQNFPQQFAAKHEIILLTTNRLMDKHFTGI